jgi:deferrochelatase/peroxidase EfeB
VKSTRRGFLRSAGLTGLGASAIGSGALLGNAGQALAADAALAQAETAAVPFYGAHQAGIATPAQNFLQFASLDMVSESIADLRKLLLRWTNAAAAMSAGRTVGSASPHSNIAPADTGEALGLPPARLTVTFGFGPTLFTSNGKDRFGLASHRPAPLVDLPAFSGDALDPTISDGDLGVQVCSDDPQVAFHAVHDLIRLAHPIATPRWLLGGFGRTGNSTSQPLPRNLMGFQDGNANIKVEDTAALDKFVWAAGPASPAWMRGGSYLVARRIQILLGLWDKTGIDTQEQSIGRHKVSGQVMTLMPPFAHILLAAPRLNGQQQILRRGYSYTTGIDSATSTTAAGLLFLCYQSDPRKQFIPIQSNIAGNDGLSPYITHIGSATFACPPGVKQGNYIGQALVG